MTIDTTIVTVSEEGRYVWLTLATSQELLITHYTRLPLAGQHITGYMGHCIVEGGDGERIVYSRQGSFLREQSE